MDPIDLFTFFEHVSFLNMFELLLKWAIPFFVILVLKDIITSLAAYVLVRSDKYVSMGKWITVNRFTGKIVKLSPFSVVIENENKDGYKIPIKDFKHIIFHPVDNDPTKCHDD